MTAVSGRCELQPDLAIGVGDTTLTVYAQSLATLPTSLPSAAHRRDNATGVMVLPFGGDANNEAFVMRVFRWFRFNETLYIPQCVFSGTCTMGNIPVDSGASPAEYMCDTIVAAESANAPECDVYSPAADDHIAHIIIDLRGCDAFSFDYGGSLTAAWANCAYGLI